MTNVAKYNTFKGVSTAITAGTPVVTLACCSDWFVHRSETAISAAGIFAIILLLIIFKDKIAEDWKVPSVFVLSTAMFIFVLLVEHIIVPIKYVCLTTMMATGVDELTFKRIYKNIEYLFPKETKRYKHCGFICASSTTISNLLPLQEDVNEES